LGYIPENNGGYQWYRFELGAYQGQVYYAYIEAQSTDGTYNAHARVSDVYHLMEYIPEVDKTGTVELVGNSVAETVIGTSVTVDVDGFQDDASGTITGTANALIERPDHVFEHLLTNLCGLSSSAINSTYYAAAGSLYSSNSINLAFALTEKPDVQELLNEIARQCRSWSVAPRAGAWIETPGARTARPLRRVSPPVRGRGLKPVDVLADEDLAGRPPCGGVD